MHLHNGLTHAVQLQAAYAAALGQKADAEFSGIERAGETLTPVIDLWSSLEWRYLRRENTLQQSLTVAAGGAGVRSRLGILNPIGSGLLVMVDQVQNRGTTIEADLNMGTAFTVDSSTLMRPVDSRFHTATAASGRTVLTTRAGAIGGTTTAMGAVRLTQGEIVPLGFVLRPGFALSFDPTVDNVSISLVLRVRERVALPGEL